MSPEITVIVPTHNRTRLLATTLRTILWQQDVNLEAVVLDDGSFEDSEAVVREFRDSRVRFLRHETPHGVCVARNRAAAEARGEWLAFCDDDDLWAPDKLALQLAAAREAGRAWAYGGAVHVSLELRLLSAKRPPPPPRLVRTLPRWNLMPGGSSNVIVRADTFATAGGWDSRLVNLADWDLWARLAKEGPPACVERPLVGYRIHAGNASADTQLILREARLIDGRYGAKLDYGEMHHYLAWVYLRSGRRRGALAHLAQAAVRGQALNVSRTLGGLAWRQIGNVLPALRRNPSAIHEGWMAEADTWIAPLRDTAVSAA